MIPPAVWAQLKPTDKIQYQKIETELRKPKDPPANSDTVVALHRMAITDPAKFSGLNLEKYRSFVTPGEFDELAASQARAAKPTSAFDPRPKIDETISRQKKWSGLDVDKDATEGFRVRRYIEAQANAAKAGGKEPVQQDYDRWFGEATKMVHVTRSFAGIDYLAADTEKRASQILSPQYRDLIRRQFRGVNGRWPTEDETQAWFDKMGAKG
jgi:soluble lytic murein transglycosylase